MTIGSYIDSTISTIQNGYQTAVNKAQPYVDTALSPMVYIVDNYFPENVKNSSKLTKICAVWCAVNALEMGVRSVVGVGSILTLKNEFLLPTLQSNLSKDLAGALFYGACAMNPIPGLAKAASVVSYLLATATYYSEDSYYTWQAANKFNNLVVKPICDNIIFPLSETVWKVAEPIIKLMHTTATLLFSFMGKIKIPFNRTWFALGCLTVAITAYKVWKSRPTPPPPTHVCPNCNHSFKEIRQQ